MPPTLSGENPLAGIRLTTTSPAFLDRHGFGMAAELATEKPYHTPDQFPF